MSLNNLIDQANPIFDIYDSNQTMTGIKLNYTLVENPIFSKQYIVLPVDGTFYIEGDSKTKPSYENMPVHKFDDEIAQFWISEYTCNSAVKSWHHKGLINTIFEID